MTTIPDDMVERVARAILKARFYDCEPDMYDNDVERFNAEIGYDEHFESAKHEARAAIEAMQPSILAERERCAKVAESLPGQRGNSPEHLVGRNIAAAIRSQS